MAENICSIDGDHTKTATTRSHHTELVCALLIPCFYTSDFETETEKQQSTQIHCKEGYTVAHIRQELWGHIRTKISFLVDKNDAGMPYISSIYLKRRGNGQRFAVS